MKRNFQTLTVILLICTMLLSITACRKNKPEISSNSSDINSNVSSVIEDALEDEDLSDKTESVLENNDLSDKTQSVLENNGLSDKTESVLENNDLSDTSDLNSDNNDVIVEISPSDSSEKEDEESADTVVEVDKNDKPFVKYPAYLEYPMKSNFDSQSDTLRETILSAKDTLPKTVTGTIWYISNNGKSTNSGKSPNEAWDSVFAMNFYKNNIKAGDAVLFERGGVYRGTFHAISGVYYGAYGKGDKPCIYGSERNYSKVVWRYKNANIWVCEAPFTKDVGTVIFNHGEFIGFKKAKNYEMENNGDFWCDKENSYMLYMYMDKNPSEAYKSIEIAINSSIITIGSETKDITIENLCIKYTGAHGINVENNVKNITVRNCEIGFIGGSYLSGTVRYGNAIQLWQACENITLENNWIYQIFDTGITHQGGGEYIAKNILMRKNLIEYCGLGSYEYWLSGGWETCRGENITFADNICRFAGYCWGGVQRSNKVSTHIRSDVSCRNTVFDFKITNNIFDQASANLLEIGGTAVKVSDIPQNPAPVLSGNIYAQSIDGYLGTYFAKAGILFDEDREVFITTYMGDKNAKIYTY